MLNTKALGLAGGVLWGLAMFVLTLIWMQAPDYGVELSALLVGIYPGYSLRLGGAFVGLLWGFVDAGIGLAIFGWLYNKFAGCCDAKGKKK